LGQSMIDSMPLYSERYAYTNHTKPGRRNPAISGLEMPWNAYSAPHILAALFQSGSDSTGLKTFSSSQCSFLTINNDDTSAAPAGGGGTPVVLTIARSFAASGAEDHYITGAVVSSVTISGDVNGMITMSADLIGLQYSYAATVTVAAANIDKLGLVYPFIDFDGSGAYSIDIAGTAATARSFSLTFANNARTTAWSSKDAQAIVFGPKIDVTGEVVLQADVESTGGNTVQGLLGYLTGSTDKLLTVKAATGAVDAAGEWSIESNMRLTGDPEVTEGENAYDVRVQFKGVYKDASNHDIRILCHDGTTGWGAVA